VWEEESMKKPKGIDPTQAREKVQSGRARLVCAYDEEEKCRKILLDGATTMSRFREEMPRVSKDEEIILFCA
jgi:hypothetical protein